MRRVRPECPVHTERNIWYTLCMVNGTHSAEQLKSGPDEGEKKFWKGTDLTTYTSDVKTLEAVKRMNCFKSEPYQSFNYLVIGAGRDVSILEAFSDVPIDHITFLQRGKDETNKLASHGLKAIKGEPEWHDFGKKGDDEPSVEGFNVVLVMDDVRVTPHFMQNIASRGFVIGRGPLVAALEETGNYKIMGAVEHDGMAPSLKKGERGELKGQVRDDEEFKAAGKMKGKASYEDAVNALDKRGLKVEEIKRKGAVLAEYQKLQGSEPEKNEKTDTVDVEEAANAGARGTDQKPDEELKNVPWRTTDTSLLWVVRREY